MDTTAPYVVGFRGIAGCGKTTIVGQVRSKDVLNQYERVSFAGPIKDGLKVMGISKFDTSQLYRETAQFVGATARGMYTDFWVMQFKRVLKTLPLHKIVLVDDVRYANELQVCDLVIFLVNSSQDPNTYLPEAQRDHESELMNRQTDRDLRPLLTPPSPKEVYPVHPRFYGVRNDVSEGGLYRTGRLVHEIIQRCHDADRNPNPV